MSFFETVWLSSYRAVGEDIANNPEPYVIDGKARLSRAIFRASLNSDRGKSFRHWMERSFGGELSGTSSRSRLLSEPAKVFGIMIRLSVIFYWSILFPWINFQYS